MFDRNEIMGTIEATERPKAERERGQVVYSFGYITDAEEFVQLVKKEPHAFVTDPTYNYKTRKHEVVVSFY